MKIINLTTRTDQILEGICIEKSIATKLKLPTIMVDTFDFLGLFLPKELQGTPVGQALAKKIPRIRYLEGEEISYYHLTGGEIAGLSRGDANSANFYLKNKNDLRIETPCVNLHNHTSGGTLSLKDLKTFLGTNIQSMLATNPKEGYAFIHKINPSNTILLNDENFKIIFDDFYSKTNFAQIKIIRKGLKENKPPLEIFKEVDSFYDNQIKRFVKKVENIIELKYEYKPGEIRLETSHNYNKNLDEIREDFIKDSHTEEEADELFNILDKIPIEKLYLAA